MKNQKSNAFEVIKKSIDQLNSQIDNNFRLDQSADTVLFGKNGKLDSLGLINLIVAVEQNIEDEFDISLTLADERAMSQRHSPFRTVGSLVDYISMLFEEESND